MRTAKVTKEYLEVGCFVEVLDWYFLVGVQTLLDEFAIYWGMVRASLDFIIVFACSDHFVVDSNMSYASL